MFDNGRNERFYDIIWVTDFSSLSIPEKKRQLNFKGEITRSYIFYIEKEAYWVLEQTILFEAGRSFSARYSDNNLFPHWKAKFG